MADDGAHFESLGTTWRLASRRGDHLPAAAIDAARAAINEIDLFFSRFRADSAVMCAGRTGGTFELPSWSLPMWRAYATIGDATVGAVSPLVGFRLAELGYGPRCAADRIPDRSAPAPNSIRRNLFGALPKVTVEPGDILDVGAAGKGLAVDRAFAALRDHVGHDELLVDAGGDIRVGGAKARIAMEYPRRPGTAIGTVELSGCAIACSAPWRRSWDVGDVTVHHLLNAVTGLPAPTFDAVWVVADTTMSADILATALFVVGEPGIPTLQREFDFEWFTMRGTAIAHSPGFPFHRPKVH